MLRCAHPSISRSKGVDPAAPVCATQELFYVLVFQHPGATTAGLTDALDACLDPATVSALMPETECALNGTTISCSGIPLDANGRGQTSFAAKPRLGCARGRVIANQATVTFNDAFQLLTNATANQLVGCERICNDGIDNDGDGQPDCADSDCQDRSCNDGSLCTGNDQCNAGVCVGSPLCDACQTCDPAVGCTGAPCPSPPTDTPTGTPTETSTSPPTGTPTATPTDTPTSTPTRTGVPMATAAPSEGAAGPQACDDDIDNDRNGLTDCQDPSCFGVAPCAAPVPVVSAPLGGVLAGGLTLAGLLALARSRKRSK